MVTLTCIHCEKPHEYTFENVVVFFFPLEPQFTHFDYLCGCGCKMSVFGCQEVTMKLMYEGHVMHGGRPSADVKRDYYWAMEGRPLNEDEESEVNQFVQSFETEL